MAAPIRKYGKIRGSINPANTDALTFVNRSIMKLIEWDMQRELNKGECRIIMKDFKMVEPGG